MAPRSGWSFAAVLPEVPAETVAFRVEVEPFAAAEVTDFAGAEGLEPMTETAEP